MGDGVVTDRTRITAVPDQPLEISRTRTIDELVEGASFLRNVTRAIGENVAETERQAGQIHHEAAEIQLNYRARQLAKQDPTDLLNGLAGNGFSWRDIARLVGVSVPAVRRWRQGETPTGVHLLAIARIVAFMETLRQDHLVTDVASWMEMPFTNEVPVTGLDLAADGRYSDLLDLAGGHASPEDVLDRWHSNWQSRYQSRFQVFEAPDGEHGIRMVTTEEP